MAGEAATYAQFTENNDWEGEIWHFWIPIPGNEAALTELAEAIGETDDADPYQLDLEPTPEFEVDILVKHSEVGYLHFQNKLAGKLTLPDPIDVEKFYKGGIRDFVTDGEKAERP